MEPISIEDIRVEHKEFKTEYTAQTEKGSEYITNIVLTCSHQRTKGSLIVDHDLEENITTNMLLSGLVLEIINEDRNLYTLI